MGNGQVVPIEGDMIPEGRGSLFFDVTRFEHAQRVAKMLCASTMVPEHFRGERSLGNVLIALNFAERHMADPFMIMQNIYIVHGRPGIEGKLVIALVNKSGRFEPLKFKFDDDKNPRSCTCYTIEKKTGQELSQTVTWEQVEAEGWNKDKKNKKTGYVQKSKWNTIRSLMFQYRSATFFARVYCPEVLMGMQTTEELSDVYDLEPQPDGSYSVKGKTEAKVEGLKEKIKKQQSQQQDTGEGNPLVVKNDTADDPGGLGKEGETVEQMTEKPEVEPEPEEEGEYRLWHRVKNFRTNYCSEVWKLVKSGEINDATEADLVKMKKKWDDQGTGDPFPLDAPEAQAEEDPVPDPDPKSKLISCPNRDGDFVEKDWCNAEGRYVDSGCRDRKNCPAWEKVDKF